MPTSKLPLVKPGQPIRAKTFNDLIKRVNALSNVRGDGAVRVHQHASGIGLSLAQQPSAMAFQVVADTPVGQGYVTAREMRWINGAWSIVNTDPTITIYDMSEGQRLSNWTHPGWNGVATWNASRGVWVIESCDHVARYINALLNADLEPGASISQIEVIDSWDGLAPEPDLLPVNLLNAADGGYSGLGRSGGSNYTDAKVNFSGGGGTGATANASIQSGQIVTINVTNGGSGYGVIPPAVTITSNSGTGATAVARVDNGQVVGVDVANSGGSQFTAIWRDDLDNTNSWVYSIIDGGCVQLRATAQATLAMSGQTGSVNGVIVLNGGSGYINPPTVTFTPVNQGLGAKGSGAVATATTEDGMVIGITVQAGGSGYTTPPTVNIG